MTTQKKQGKRGSRKIGNNKIKCGRYVASNRREKNKARRAKKREKKFARRKRILALRAAGKVPCKAE